MSHTPPAGPALNNAIQELFNTYEARVLGTMGLFVGYICIFFAKIMSFTNIYVGVAGVAIITLLLLLLNKGQDWKSQDWWIRLPAVIIFSVLLTSPQLYFAWTVSVNEARSAAQAAHDQLVHDARQFVQPEVTIIPKAKE
jgi:hypothetical protein